MKNIRSIYALALLCFLPLLACSDDNGTGPSSGNNTDDGGLGGNFFPSAALQNVDGVFASFNVRTETGIPDPDFAFINARTGFAFFKGSDRNPGTIMLNELGFRKLGVEEGWTQFQTSAQSSEEIFEGIPFGDGISHTWTVDGSGDVAQLQESIESPTEIDIILPLPNSTHSGANRIQAQWRDDDPSTGNWYVLHVYDNAGNNLLYPDMPPTGSFTVPASDVQQLTPGAVMVQIIKMNYRIVQAGAKSYSLVAEFASQAPIAVQ